MAEKPLEIMCRKCGERLAYMDNCVARAGGDYAIPPHDCRKDKEQLKLEDLRKKLDELQTSTEEKLNKLHVHCQGALDDFERRIAELERAVLELEFALECRVN